MNKRQTQYALLGMVFATLSFVISVFPLQVVLAILSFCIASWSAHLLEVSWKPEKSKGGRGAKTITALSVDFAVCSLLYCLIAPTIRDVQIHTNYARCRQDLSQIRSALGSYRYESGCYPRTLVPYLTTPIAYLPTIPTDSLAKSSAPHLYKVTERGCFLVGVGPDGRFSPI